MRLLPTSREILRTLDICPWISVDALAALIGARSRVSVYQALARLTAAGLTERRQVRLGPLAGLRPTSLWAVSGLGHAIRGTAGSESPTLCGGDGRLPLGSGGGRSRQNIADPLRIAAARALAAWLADQAARGYRVKLTAWGSPWIGQGVAGTTMRFPAAAAVESVVTTGEQKQLIVILPDLGTAPIIRFRTALWRLVESLAQSDSNDARCTVRLVLVTTNVDGYAARAKAWTQLIERLHTQTGNWQLRMTIMEWHEVQRLLGLVRVPGPRYDTDHRARRRPTARRLRADELLDLLGRHPFLTTEQLAALLAVTRRRVRMLRQSLLEHGLLRLIPHELRGWSTSRSDQNSTALTDIAELTAAGRRRLAHQLGLPVDAARRHHGLFGGSPRHRHRALRHLAHTIGANEVFVTLAVAARTARLCGADETLEQWRPATACEHWRCKPDGYGCYRRGDQRFGFLLEYDRGTERARQYDAKLASYFAYCNSGQAARDYAGLPHVLFVTNSHTAEERILDAIERAFARNGDYGFSFLTTTTTRIEASGILGAIWRPGFTEVRSSFWSATRVG